MAKLLIEVEIQTYDEDETEVLEQIRKTVVDVVSLADLAVGTFVKSEIK